MSNLRKTTAPPPPHQFGTDFAKLDAHVITPEEYEEIPELTDEDFARGTRHKGGKPIAPPFPGEVLESEWLKPMGITPQYLAEAIGVPSNIVTEVIEGRRAINAEMALRLARYFATDARSWLNLQMNYELAMANAEFGATIGALKPFEFKATSIE
jgi:addiction module HigA family antidote